VRTFGDFEEHVLPSGQPVYYRDRDHSYWRDVEMRRGEYGGKGRLTGVTTVVAPYDWRPDNLMRWAAKSNGAGVAMLAAEALCCETLEEMRASLRWLETPESIWQALEDARATYEDLREEAGEKGTNVHKHALHELALGRPVPAYSEMTEQEKGFAGGIVAFFLDHDPETLQAEQVIADHDLGIAGRFDLRCIPRSRCEDRRCPCRQLMPGEIVLVDAKTSGYISLKAHAQLAGYEHGACVSGIGDSSAQWVLQVFEDGSYRLIPARATAEDFTVAVDLYRRAARIGRDIGADRRLREEVPA
jgi:hypothetical protein